MPKLAAPALDVSMVINAPADAVFAAFFNHDALAVWWQVIRSVTTPRMLGPFVVEWPTGRVPRRGAGASWAACFAARSCTSSEGRGFFVADAYWLPPDGNPIGPMALEVACSAEDCGDGQAGTRVRVTQNGFEESSRWRRYYEVVEVGWQRALRTLKTLLES